MRFRPLPGMIIAALALTSCSFGPRLQSALPMVRDVPVLAGLSSAQSLERARIFLASGQYGLAIELFKAASRDPSLEVDSLNGLAVAYDGIGRRDVAERYFQRALALRTDDQRTRRNLATFYAASRQSEKRRSLLAEGAGAPAGEPAEMSRSPATEPGLSAEPSPAEHALAIAGVELRKSSPLGTSFSPLLIEARLSDRPLTLSPSSSDEMAIACLASANPGDRSDTDGMRMLRISVGEVFIATRVAGSVCSIVPESAVAMPQPAGMSNKVYLGLVAAYLDQINRLGYFAGVGLPTAQAAI